MKQKLSEFMATEIPDVDFKTIEKVIKAHWRYESSNRKKHCDICLRELTEEERGKSTIYDFLFVCSEHDKYRSAFHVENIRREIGIDINTPEYFQ